VLSNTFLLSLLFLYIYRISFAFAVYRVEIDLHTSGNAYESVFFFYLLESGREKGRGSERYMPMFAIVPEKMRATKI